MKTAERWLGFGRCRGVGAAAARHNTVAPEVPDAGVSMRRVPWHVKGVRPDAREAARDAARRSGLSVGEWLNSLIIDAAAHEDSAAGGQRAPAPPPPPAPFPPPRRSQTP